MGNNMKYRFFMSQLTHIQDIKETDKTKISVVFYDINQSSCILRVCKNRDLSRVCEVLIKTKNPNTVVIYDYVYENGNTYILEENLTGKTVEEILEQRGSFREVETAKIIISVCNALEKLHSETPPVIHNDINPSNIMIRDDMSVKLFDFDISRVFKKGNSKNTTLFGTEEYASPEHFGYGQSEPRTDIYCLGVTMHKMLTGHSLTPEHRITYKGPLKKIILKCMEFDPKNRYTSVCSLRKDLEKSLTKRARTIAVMVSLISLFFSICLFMWLTSGGTDKEAVNLNVKVISEDSKNENTTENDARTVKEDRDSNRKKNFSDVKKDIGQSDEFGDNHSRKNAKNVTLNKEYSQSLGKKGAANWYGFTTMKYDSIYRFSLFTGILSEDSYIYAYYVLALYDTDGIKIEEFDVYCKDEYGFADIHLEADTTYLFKIYGKNGTADAVGNYSFVISERICDAGVDKESAKSLKIGNEQRSKMDSVLSDWYVINIENSGDYVVNLHNINVGCTIDINGYINQSSSFSGRAHNEDSVSRAFNAKDGDKVYIEIDAGEDIANGNYILVVDQQN